MASAGRCPGGRRAARVCTEPGRSTIITRRAPAAFGVKVRWPGPPPVQSPRWRSAACTTVSGSTGPARIRCAVLGPQCVAWKVRTSSRVRASTVSGVPADRRRYGVDGVEQVAQEHLVGQAAGIGASLQDVGEALRLEPIELAGVQPRLADHLGQQRDAVVGMLGERLEGGACRVPAGLAADLDARVARWPRQRRRRPGVACRSPASGRSALRRRPVPRPPPPPRRRPGGAR